MAVAVIGRVVIVIIDVTYSMIIIRESIRRARESFYIDKAKTMQPHGINRDDY